MERVKAALRTNLETHTAVETQRGFIERMHHQVSFGQTVAFEVSQAVSDQSVSDAMTAPFRQNKDVLRKTGPNAAALIILFVPIDAGAALLDLQALFADEVKVSKITE